MDMQLLVVLLVFVLALFFAGRRMALQISKKKSGTCEKCDIPESNKN